MQGWEIEIEGIIVMVSFYGNSDHNHGGGGHTGEGRRVHKIRVGSRGLGPGIGLFYFGFSLSCNQVYIVIRVTKKIFYGVGAGGGQ